MQDNIPYITIIQFQLQKKDNDNYINKFNPTPLTQQYHEQAKYKYTSWTDAITSDTQQRTK